MPNRPPRLPEFDYRGANRYFLTICVFGREPAFLDLDAGRFVMDQFLRIAASFKFEVIAHLAMPDHFHGLVQGEDDSCALEAFMHRYKQATGFWWKRQDHRTQLWQEGYFDRVLREGDSTEAVVRYILLNPVRAGLVRDAREYPLFGSSKYDVETLLESSFFWEPPWK